MAKPKKRKAKKRQSVSREERDAGTPETIAKLQPDMLDLLLRRGPDAGGIDNQQFEALWAIRDAAHVVGREPGYQTVNLDSVGHGEGPMSDGDARRWDVYIEWSREFMRLSGLAPGIVRAWVDRDRAIRPVEDLRHLALAAKLWGRCLSSYDKEREAEANTQNRVLTCGL